MFSAAIRPPRYQRSKRARAPGAILVLSARTCGARADQRRRRVGASGAVGFEGNAVGDEAHSLNLGDRLDHRRHPRGVRRRRGRAERADAHQRGKRNLRATRADPRDQTERKHHGGAVEEIDQPAPRAPARRRAQATGDELRLARLAGEVECAVEAPRMPVALGERREPPVVLDEPQDRGVVEWRAVDHSPPRVGADQQRRYAEAAALAAAGHGRTSRPTRRRST